MRVLLLGADGQLGFELRGSLGCIAELTALGRDQCDLAQLDQLRNVVLAVRPELIVNAAAFTDVDGAEEHRAHADAINWHAVAALGQQAREQRFGLVHVSTDFVFDGRGDRPYLETDPTGPVNAYGESKLAGERALIDAAAPAIILRTAWVYGLRRKSFVSTIVRLATEREQLRVVDDQLGNPTFCRDLASGIAAIAGALRADPHAACVEASGIYHLAGGGVASRHELATSAVALHPHRNALAVKRIDAIPSEAMPMRAARPRYTPLDCGKARERFGVALPDWRDALARAMRDAC
jgi:dTDP-4-dehydrorhamnose reductase